MMMRTLTDKRRGRHKASCWWLYDDGGRAAAGYEGDAGDCVTRAIAIATGTPYREVYDRLHQGGRELVVKDAISKRRKRKLRNPSPRDGVSKRVYRPYIEDELGWEWVPTMKIGSGCQVHLTAEELPAGRLIVRCSRHLVAVVDGMIHDTFDCSRGGTRCVYGYWREKGA